MFVHPKSIEALNFEVKRYLTSGKDVAHTMGLMSAPKKLQGDEKKLAEQIGARLKQFRESFNKDGSGITQEQFGALCECGKSNVSSWEKGLHFPRLQSLVKLHKHKRFAWDWLMNGGDPMVNQIVDFYKDLSREGRDKLLSNANWLHNEEHPGTSAAQPFIDKAQAATPDSRTLRKAKL